MKTALYCLSSRPFGSSALELAVEHVEGEQHLPEREVPQRRGPVDLAPRGGPARHRLAELLPHGLDDRHERRRLRVGEQGALAVLVEVEVRVNRGRRSRGLHGGHPRWARGPASVVSRRAPVNTPGVTVPESRAPAAAAAAVPRNSRHSPQGLRHGPGARGAPPQGLRPVSRTPSVRRSGCGRPLELRRLAASPGGEAAGLGTLFPGGPPGPARSIGDAPAGRSPDPLESAAPWAHLTPRSRLGRRPRGVAPRRGGAAPERRQGADGPPDGSWTSSTSTTRRARPPSGRSPAGRRPVPPSGREQARARPAPAVVGCDRAGGETHLRRLDVPTLERWREEHSLSAGPRARAWRGCPRLDHLGGAPDRSRPA